MTIRPNARSGLTHENPYSQKNNRYRKKSAALPAAALPFAAADRDWNRTAQNFFEILLAIPYSTALQKMSIFENAVLVRESAHVYTQVCFANLQLKGRAILASRLNSVRAARRQFRCLAFRLFYVSTRFFSKYPFPVRLSRRYYGNTQSSV